MTKYQDFTGKTENLALETALKTLGLERDDVSVEILERAKSGFLGIGSSPAKIRVSYEAPDEDEADTVVDFPVAETAPAQETPQKVVYEAPKEEIPEEDAQDISREGPTPVLAPEATHPVDDEVSEAIIDFLTGLLAHMKVEATPTVSLSDRGSYEVLLVGKNLGGIIGRRGETLDAIQQLTGYAVNRGRKERARVHLDAEGYRAKREESLAALARRTAEKAIRLRGRVTLEPMNAYERHVIHTALQGYPHISTHSIGVEPNRRTVVCYEEEETWEE